MRRRLREIEREELCDLACKLLDEGTRSDVVGGDLLDFINTLNVCRCRHHVSTGLSLEIARQCPAPYYKVLEIEMEDRLAWLR